MAKKTKPAARGAAKAAAKPKPSAPKKAAAKSKSSKKTAVKAKPPAAPAKPPAKSAPKTTAPKVSVDPPKVAATAAPQIARAKSALGRQRPSVPAVPAVAASAAPKAERTRARKITIEINPNEAASALAAKWSTLFKRAEQIEAKPYNMTAAFEERTAIVHKVLGWGYILTNRNDRLEVLFKDGIKYLISNYKP